MNELYEELAEVGLELIRDFGRPINVHFTSQQVRNPVQGTTTGAYTQTVFQGVVCQAGGKLMSDVRMVGNASIMTTDVEVLFASDVTLKDSDKLEFDGIVWSILKLAPINPGGQLILTKVTVRR